MSNSPNPATLFDAAPPNYYITLQQNGVDVGYNPVDPNVDLYVNFTYSNTMFQYGTVVETQYGTYGTVVENPLIPYPNGGLLIYDPVGAGDDYFNNCIFSSPFVTIDASILLLTYVDGFTQLSASAQTLLPVPPVSPPSNPYIYLMNTTKGYPILLYESLSEDPSVSSFSLSISSSFLQQACTDPSGNICPCICQFLYPVSLFCETQDQIQYNYYQQIVFSLVENPSVEYYPSIGTVLVNASDTYFYSTQQTSPYWNVGPNYGIINTNTSPPTSAIVSDDEYWPQNLNPCGIIPATNVSTNSLQFNTTLLLDNTYVLAVNCTPLAGFCYSPYNLSSYLGPATKPDFNYQQWQSLGIYGDLSDPNCPPQGGLPNEICNIYQGYNTQMLIQYGSTEEIQIQQVSNLYYSPGYYTPILNVPPYTYNPSVASSAESMNTVSSLTAQTAVPRNPSVLNLKERKPLLPISETPTGITINPPKVNSIVPDYTFELSQNGIKIHDKPVSIDYDLEITFETTLHNYFENNHIDIPGLICPKFDYGFIFYGNRFMSYASKMKKNNNKYTFTITKKYLNGLYSKMDNNGGILCYTIFRGFFDREENIWKTTHFNFPFMLENNMYYTTFWMDNLKYKHWFVDGGYTYNLKYYGLSDKKKNTVLKDILKMNDLKDMQNINKHEIQKINEIFFEETFHKGPLYLCVSPYKVLEKTHEHIKYYITPYYSPVANLPSYSVNS